MNFTHHPRGPWMWDPTRTYNQWFGPKPGGLWLSVDDDWMQWCVANDHGITLWFTHPAIEFVMVRTDTVRIVSTPEELDDFTADFIDSSDPFGYEIDWQSVADKYAGIIIAPYQRDRRYAQNANWYYGWDCASACIWDLSVIHPKDTL